MKINQLFTLFTVISAFIMVSDRIEALDIKNIIAGVVKEVKVDSIKIQDGLNSNEVRVIIDPNTVYDNIQKTTDLKAGDKVQVEYQTNHNNNIAISITKVEKGGDI